MKNIHVLQTDKSSEFYSIDGKHKLANSTMAMDWYISSVGYKPHNIYITSDEEIKDEDYCVHTNQSSIIKIGKWEGKLMKGHLYLKKIILTTDPDLIKDGVQAIDDEFLEWFVKNPSCEKVEVEEVYPLNCCIKKEGKTKMNNGCMERNRCLNYKIIIPQEEPKQDYSGVHFKHCYQGEYEDGCKYGEDDCPAKPRPFVNTMPMFYIVKQETLEEAAKRYARKQCDDMYDNKGLTGASWGWETSLDFIAGAKWQAQKMYSGEEVRKILLDITLINPTHLTLLESGYGQFPDSYKLTEKGINYIIEQFKKK